MGTTLSVHRFAVLHPSGNQTRAECCLEFTARGLCRGVGGGGGGGEPPSPGGVGGGWGGGGAPIPRAELMPRGHNTQPSTTAQREIWPVRGLQDHRYRSVKRET